MRQLCEEAFPAGEVEVEGYGNELVSAVMFLYGFAAEELATEEMSLRDPDFEVIVAVRAFTGPCPHGPVSVRSPPAALGAARARHVRRGAHVVPAVDRTRSGVVLMYHRVEPRQGRPSESKSRRRYTATCSRGTCATSRGCTAWWPPTRSRTRYASAAGAGASQWR